MARPPPTVLCTGVGGKRTDHPREARTRLRPDAPASRRRLLRHRPRRQRLVPPPARLTGHAHVLDPERQHRVRGGERRRGRLVGARLDQLSGRAAVDQRQALAGRGARGKGCHQGDGDDILRPVIPRAAAALWCTTRQPVSKSRAGRELPNPALHFPASRLTPCSKLRIAGLPTQAAVTGAATMLLRVSRSFFCKAAISAA